MNIQEIDDSKIEDAILALLCIFEFDNGRSWKRYNFEVMDRLYAQGLITNPRSKAESVFLTAEGKHRGEFLAAKLFSKDSSS